MADGGVNETHLLKESIKEDSVNGYPRSNSPNDPSGEKIGLERQLGLLSLVAFLIGSIIGSGIFATPMSVAKHAGSTGAILFVWIGSGVISIFGSFTWCELALMFPNACGNEYTYLFETFGNFPAFAFIYLSAVSEPPGLALISMVAGDYVMTAIVGKGDSIYSKLIAGCIIVFNMLVHCFSVKGGGRTQIFFTGMKLIPIAMLVITGFVRLGQGHTENFTDAFNGSSTKVSDIGYAVYGGLFSYGGWSGLNHLMAESVDPIKHTPIAILIGMPLIIVCYVMVNIAYLTVMTPLEIARSNAVAVTIAKDLYGVVHWIIPLMVALSCIGTANAHTFYLGRLVYEASNKKHLPKFLGAVHVKRHTPIPAIVTCSIIALITLLPEKSNFENLLNFLQFLAWTKIAITIVALLWLRKSRPLMKRPFKVFIGVPITLLICSIFVIFAPFYNYPVPSSIGLAILLPSIPLYFAFVKYQIIPDRMFEKLDILWKKLERFGNLAQPDYKTSEPFVPSDSSEMR